jgi:chromosome segregation protein
MGEQSPKLLRARNMEDLLFNGSKGKGPAALAEVTLTLARETEKGPAETSITRRLYRGGDSEYLIGRHQTRLKDILRFFIEAGMGTRAYAIIEQEKVGRLVDARAEERRILLDEAAGITRYKEQKKDSERKIEQASQNLAAFGAVMAETKKQLALVARQASQARKYEAIKLELMGLEQTLMAKRFLSLTLRKSELTELITVQMATALALIAEASKLELESENFKLSDNQAAQMLEDELTSFHNLDAILNNKRAEKNHLEETINSKKERQAKCQEELLGLSSEKEKYLLDKERLEGLLETLAQDNLEAQEEAIVVREDYLSLKSRFEAAQNEVTEAKNREFSARDELNRYSETVAGAKSLAEHLIGRKRELELEKNEISYTLQEAKEKIQARSRFKANLESDLMGLEETLEFLKEDEADARKALNDANSRLSPLDTKAASLEGTLSALEDLEASFSWHPPAVSELMGHEELIESGLMGPVSDNIEIPNGFERAFECYLGERLSWLVVKDRDTALKTMSLAKEKSLGKYGLVILSAIPKGDLSRTLLGPINLAQAEEPDIATLNPNSFYLTLKGDFISPQIITGQGTSKAQNDKGVLMRLKELSQVRLEYEEAQKSLLAIKEELISLREAHEMTKEALTMKQGEKAGLQGDLNRADSKLNEAKGDERGLAIRAENLDSEIKRVEGDLKAAGEKEKIAFEQKLASEEKYAAICEELVSLEEALKALGQSLGELKEREAIASRESNLAQEKLQGAKRELIATNKFLDSLSGRREALTTEIAELSNELLDLEIRLKDLSEIVDDYPKALEIAEQKLAKARENRLAIKDKMVQMEDLLRQARKNRESAQDTLNGLEKDLLEVNFGLNQLSESLKRNWWAVFNDPYAKEEKASEIDEKTSLQEELEELEEQEKQEEQEEQEEEELEELEKLIAKKEELVGPAGPIEASNGPLNPSEASNQAPLTEEGPETLEASPKEDIPPPLAVLDPLELSAIELPENSEERASKLRQRLNSMGEVNLKAIEEERELKKRYDFYEVQYNDLDKAIKDLRAGINRINQICRERFTKTFAEADAKFQEIFPVLFEGGEGWLKMSPGVDPLEAGVEIHVHPRGKKIMVMSLLSGGEKALTALALIFALYLIKPSPFCLLDEADAPLDEANIDRFNRLLRRLSESSQIIMVTHNKRTMQISDTLYGVTMETPGVSRLVSVNLTQAEVLTN